MRSSRGPSAARIDHANQKCKTPEPDCVDIACRAIEGTNQCEDYDDYWFAEKNECVTAAGKVCRLSDLSDCEDYQVCTKNPLFACTNNGESDCDTWHNNCTVNTIQAYDDCVTDPDTN